MKNSGKFCADELAFDKSTGVFTEDSFAPYAAKLAECQRMKGETFDHYGVKFLWTPRLHTKHFGESF